MSTTRTIILNKNRDDRILFRLTQPSVGQIMHDFDAVENRFVHHTQIDNIFCLLRY